MCIRDRYTENPNITGVIRLSDYNPNLKDTPGDVDIYVFDSGIPGGKALIYGGTHTNEVGSMLNAVTYLENVKCEEGTLYVMVRANNSGYSHTCLLYTSRAIFTSYSAHTAQAGVPVLSGVHLIARVDQGLDGLLRQPGLGVHLQRGAVRG